MNTTTTTKVLPFDCKRGHVAGHEIKAAVIGGDAVKHVVMETWDREAEMMVEILVHWTEWTKYMRRKWPSGEAAVAVILDSGRRIHCKGWSVGYHGYRGEADYLAAPIICRDTYKLTTLGGETVIEIVGVGAWAYSKRDEAATAKYLIDPWERDNKIFREQMQARGAQI